MRQLVRELVYTSLLLIITLRLTCDERNTCSTIKKSQNILNMIVGPRSSKGPETGSLYGSGSCFLTAGSCVQILFKSKIMQII